MERSQQNIFVNFQPNILRIVGFYVRHSAKVRTSVQTSIGRYCKGLHVCIWNLGTLQKTSTWNPITLLTQGSELHQEQQLAFAQLQTPVKAARADDPWKGRRQVNRFCYRFSNTTTSRACRNEKKYLVSQYLSTLKF